MFKALQDRNYHYHNNVLSLKGQTTREGGTQSHGPHEGRWAAKPNAREATCLAGQ